MKNRTLFNKAIAMATAIAVAIQPITVLATENPTETSAKVKYEGVEAYYSVVVPKSIQLDEKGEATFNLRAEGELGGWGTIAQYISIPTLEFEIFSTDEKTYPHPGCYLYQDGKEPIFAEFHEEVSTIWLENDMKHDKIESYKDIDYFCKIKFCNQQPDWVRKLTDKELKEEEYRYLYTGMSQEQFSNYWFGYDMGTTVTITVNLEGNKPVPAGEWEGEIVIDIEDSVYSAYTPLSPNVCPEAQKAYEELIANGL